MKNALVELRNTIDEALRMHQLNLELLEQLGIACKWLRENKIQVPNRDRFVSLLSKSDALLKEIYSSDENLQGKQSDEDLTEPQNGFC